ncbi:MAG: AAA family ATPase [Dysgonamonadaceae bacterium]|jgi:GTPase SAR1 family protein|nr:AAA family ATPase [Dysgonamonadaceae bacterium]
MSEMTLKEKDAIRDSLQAYCAKYPSQNKAAGSLKGVSAGTVSTILNGKYENISDEMFRNISSQVGSVAAAGGWQIAETKAFRDIMKAMRDAQELRLVTWITGDSGCGKTTVARIYAKENREVFYIDCRKDMCRHNFVREFARTVGIKIEGHSTYDAWDFIMREIIQMDFPLIVLNEADKLCDDVFLYIIDMYNTLEDYAGIVFFSTDQIKRRVDTGLRYNKKGYQEVSSRIGRRFYDLDPTSPNDVYAVCMANGVTEKKKTDAVIKDSQAYSFDLRRVKKIIQILKRQAEQ